MPHVCWKRGRELWWVIYSFTERTLLAGAANCSRLKMMNPSGVKAGVVSAPSCLLQGEGNRSEALVPRAKQTTDFPGYLSERRSICSGNAIHMNCDDITHSGEMIKRLGPGSETVIYRMLLMKKLIATISVKMCDCLYSLGHRDGRHDYYHWRRHLDIDHVMKWLRSNGLVIGNSKSKRKAIIMDGGKIAVPIDWSGGIVSQEGEY